jgi:hypothetical protein
MMCMDAKEMPKQVRHDVQGCSSQNCFRSVINIGF